MQYWFKGQLFKFKGGTGKSQSHIYILEIDASIFQLQFVINKLLTA